MLLCRSAVTVGSRRGKSMRSGPRSNAAPDATVGPEPTAGSENAGAAMTAGRQNGCALRHIAVIGAEYSGGNLKAVAAGIFAAG